MREMLICFLLTLAILTKANSLLLDDFERGQRWRFSNGPEFPGAAGSFAAGPEGAHTGKLGGILAFDFTNGGNYVQASVSIPDDVRANGFEFFIRKACKNTVTLRVTDSESQTFQKSFNFSHDGWQKVRVTLRNWAGYWGGKGDGVFRGRPVEFGILVENDAAIKTGRIFFDDVHVIVGNQESTTTTSTYTVSDFSSGWSLTTIGDGGGSTFQPPRLHFDFGKSAREIGIRNEIALMGSPQEIRLTVSSRVAGPQIVMRLYSHFQAFEKVVGELEGTGLQTLSVPLARMKNWQHFGGENDGIVRWPLRLASISLRQGNGPQSGDVEFVSIKVMTNVTTDSAVTLVPTMQRKGRNTQFECEVTNLAPKMSTGLLHWAIRTYDGEILREGRFPLSIHPGATARCRQSILQERRPFLECQFQYITDTYVYGPVSICSALETFDFPYEQKSSDTMEVTPNNSIFGMGLYLYRYPSTADGFLQMERAARMAAVAGVKWSREEFGWARIEPSKGTFNWDFYDRMVEIAERQGIQIYGLISYWSNWTKPNTPEGIRDYAEFCKALVSRYKGRIKHWEVWNEPNIFFWTGPREVYADLLKAAYVAIKEVDPEAQVLGCSTSGIDINFIEMVMDRGAPFDALTIHPYRRTLDDEGFIQELQDVHKLTGKKDGRPKPVWITEMGWTTNIPHGVTEREQASLLARTYLCAVASGVVASVSWYDFRDDGDCPFYGEHRHGIVRNGDLLPKPAYRALGTVTSFIGGKRLVGKMNLGKGLLAYKFSDGKRDTLAIWCLDRSALLSLSLTGESLMLSDLMGTVKSLKAGRSLVVLRPNDPVFITGEGLAVSDARTVFVDFASGGSSGGRVRVKLEGIEAMPELTFSVYCPTGWKVYKKDDGFDISVGETTHRMTYQITLKAIQGSATYHVPIQVRITPSTLEI